MYVRLLKTVGEYPPGTELECFERLGRKLIAEGKAEELETDAEREDRILNGDPDAEPPRGILRA